jgi:tetratricopeptide (TPR) repeat protein
MSKKKIKKQTNYVSSTFEQSVYLAARLLLFVLITIFVVGNIAVSQAVPSELSAFFKGDVNSFVKFVHKTQKKPAFAVLYQDIKEELRANSSILFADYKEREQSIALLKSHLKIQEESPIVLLGLSILYSKQENFSEAKKYYDMAVAIDPSVGERYGWTRGDLNP